MTTPTPATIAGARLPINERIMPSLPEAGESGPRNVLSREVCANFHKAEGF